MILAILRLETHILRQYRFSWITQLVHSVFMLGIFHFISRAVGPQPIFQGQYFSFVALGIAFESLFHSLALGASGRLRDWQTQGVLQSLFVAPVARWKLLLLAGVPDGIYAVGKAVFLLLVSWLLFGADWERVRWSWLLGTTVVLFWITQALSLLGISSVLLWKRVNLVTVFTSIGTTVLAGVYFPVEVLPKWLQVAAGSIPLTHALGLFRWSIAGETFFVAPGASMGVLLAWAVLLTVLAAISFRSAERRLLQSGSLTFQ